MDLCRRERHRSRGGNKPQDGRKLKTVPLGRNVYLVARAKMETIE
jgi:hypothetical protein